MTDFQVTAQHAELGRQVPVSVYLAVVQTGGLAPQRRQVVKRIKDLSADFVTSLVARDQLALANDLNSIDIGFNRHRLKSM